MQCNGMGHAWVTKDESVPTKLESLPGVIIFSVRMDMSTVIVLIFFNILVLQEYSVLTESRIPFKLLLRGVRIVARSRSSHEQNQ